MRWKPFPPPQGRPPYSRSIRVIDAVCMRYIHIEGVVSTEYQVEVPSRSTQWGVPNREYSIRRENVLCVLHSLKWSPRPRSVGAIIKLNNMESIVIHIMDWPFANTINTLVQGLGLVSIKMGEYRDITSWIPGSNYGSFFIISNYYESVFVC